MSEKYIHSKKYFHAISIMIGTIIGAGMFTVPFVVHKSGILLFFPYIILLGGIQYFMHLMYAEIVLSTKKKHRVPGYVVEYYGKRFKKPALVLVLISMNLGLLSYLIIGGIFFQGLLSPAFGGGQFIYSCLMFVVAAALTYKGVKMIAKIELGMSAFLFLVIGIIVYKGLPHIDINNYTSVSWGNLFLPYGPIFMAIGGMTAVPTVCSLLAHKKDNIKSAIMFGSFIPLIVISLFVLTVVGVSGANTSPDSLVGLYGVMGNGVLFIALSFGLVSIITSHIMIVQATREIYHLDLGIDNFHSWILTLAVPFTLLLLGINNLTSVISLSGAVVGGIIGLIYILLVLKVKVAGQQKSIINVRIGHKTAFALSFMFIFGFLNVFEYVEVKTVVTVALVLFTYLYALIKSSKNNTSIYLELLDTTKKVGYGFILIFIVFLTFGVFSIIT